MNRPSAPRSSPSAAPRAVAIGGCAIVAIVYFVTLHLLIVDHAMAPLTLMLIVAPWLIAAASTCAKRMVARPASRIALTALLSGVAMALVACCGSVLHDRIDGLVYLENLVFVLSLAALFALSLFGPREALVTRLARVARHGDMPPAVVCYTRRVTLAWALFFTMAALISTALFANASRETWSAFVNLALWPLMILTFGVEYAVRVRTLPQIAHTSPLAGARSFMQRDVEPRGREHG